MSGSSKVVVNVKAKDQACKTSSCKKHACFELDCGEFIIQVWRVVLGSFVKVMRVFLIKNYLDIIFMSR